MGWFIVHIAVVDTAKHDVGDHGGGADWTQEMMDQWEEFVFSEMCGFHSSRSLGRRSEVTFVEQ